MKYFKALLFPVLIVFLLSNSTPLQAQARDLNGLINISSETPYGTIKIFLPKNYVAGKPVSGSFQIEPAGDRPKTQRKNANKLKGYSAQLGGKTILIKDQKFSFVPQTSALTVTLQDEKKKVITTNKVELSTKTPPGEFSFPPGIKSEGPSQIYGVFDGITENTTVLIGGKKCKILAESPVQVLFEAPKLNTASYKLQLTENKQQQAAVNTQIVNYSLSAGRLNLKKGESTYFQATITGLNFLEKPIPFIVKNLTPGVVNLEGGNFQTLMIPKQEVNYVKRWGIQSIKTGSFTISTELILPATKFPGEGGFVAAQNVGKDPCAVIKKRCDDLLKILNQKKAEAKAAKDKADADRLAAEKLKKTADDLDQKAKDAAVLAIPRDKGGSITMDEHTYYLIDNKMRDMLAQQAWADYQSGNLTNAQYQDRLKELQGPEALKEIEKQRKKLEAQLREEAKKAREKADQAKVAYDKAKAKADASQKENAKKQAELAAAQKAYDACMKKVKDECDKILAQIAKDEAERKAKIEAARLAAEKAKQEKLAEIKRQKGEAERARLRKEKVKYQLKMIRELNMLGGTGVNAKDIPEVWDWIPEFLENPVTDYATDVAEGVAGGPIPLAIFNAIGEVYKLFGSAFDPCSKYGKEVAIKKLVKKINPITKKNYEPVEALAFTDTLCNLLRDIRVKMRQLKKLRGGK